MNKVLQEFDGLEVWSTRAANLFTMLIKDYNQKTKASKRPYFTLPDEIIRDWQTLAEITKVISNSMSNITTMLERLMKKQVEGSLFIEVQRCLAEYAKWFRKTDLFLDKAKNVLESDIRRKEIDKILVLASHYMLYGREQAVKDLERIKESYKKASENVKNL